LAKEPYKVKIKVSRREHPSWKTKILANRYHASLFRTRKAPGVRQDPWGPKQKVA